jgi:thymidylate kinase
VYAGYREMAAWEPHRWRQVDASRDPDDVASKILELTVEALRNAGIRPAERRTA